MQDAAQTLLALAARPQATQQARPSPESGAAQEPAPDPVHAIPEELRCFRVPRFIAQAEKEILAEYQAEDLCDLFQRA